MYMTDRRMVVKGVPQESILGPLLFLIHMNDIRCIEKFEWTPRNLQVLMYADDFSILISSKSVLSATCTFEKT